MEYATKSLSELKVLAAKFNAIPTGDKRSKQTWIAALELVDNKIAHEEEQCSEVAEYLAQNPDAEGGFFGDYCSHHTVSSCEEPWDSDEDTIEIDDTDADTIESPDVAAVPPLPNKAKPICVFALLLCAIGLLLHTTILAICTTLKYAILLGCMFGRWNPDLDIWYQLKLLVEQRKTKLAIA